MNKKQIKDRLKQMLYNNEKYAEFVMNLFDFNYDEVKQHQLTNRKVESYNKEGQSVIQVHFDYDFMSIPTDIKSIEFLDPESKSYYDYLIGEIEIDNTNDYCEYGVCVHDLRTESYWFFFNDESKCYDCSRDKLFDSNQINNG